MLRPSHTDKSRWLVSRPISGAVWFVCLSGVFDIVCFCYFFSLFLPPLTLVIMVVLIDIAFFLIWAIAAIFLLAASFSPAMVHIVMIPHYIMRGIMPTFGLKVGLTNLVRVSASYNLCENQQAIEICESFKDHALFMLSIVGFPTPCKVCNEEEDGKIYFGIDYNGCLQTSFVLILAGLFYLSLIWLLDSLCPRLRWSNLGANRDAGFPLKNEDGDVQKERHRVSNLVDSLKFGNDPMVAYGLRKVSSHNRPR